jgi:hypothetical protein
MALIKFGLSISAKVRGNDPVKSQEHSTLSAQSLAAFQQGDSSAYTSALSQLAAMAATTLSAADQQQIHAQEQELVNELPLPIKQFQHLLAQMCLGGAKVDPNSVLNVVSKTMAAESGTKKTRK